MLKRNIGLALASLVFAGGAVAWVAAWHAEGQLAGEEGGSAMAACTGAADCKVCKNCRYCRHCAKEGGTCGVNQPTTKKGIKK